MADAQITISNTLTIFGPERTNKWGSFEWGENWGYGDLDLQVTVNKLISNTISLSDALATVLDINKTISNSLAISGDLTNESIIDTNGYYTFFGPGSNAENRPLTQYTSLSENDASYSAVVAPGTSYTEV